MTIKDSEAVDNLDQFDLELLAPDSGFAPEETSEEKKRIEAKQLALDIQSFEDWLAECDRLDALEEAVIPSSAAVAAASATAATALFKYPSAPPPLHVIDLALFQAAVYAHRDSVRQRLHEQVWDVVFPMATGSVPATVHMFDEKETRKHFPTVDIVVIAGLEAHAQHAQLIPVLGIGHADGGKLLFALQAPPGPTLYTHVVTGAAGRLANRLVVALDVAEALAVFHAAARRPHGAVHAKNVFVDARGRGVLGVGMPAILPPPPLPEPGVVMSVLVLTDVDVPAPPEIADCLPLGPWTDVFAFGALLWQLWCGRPPIDIHRGVVLHELCMELLDGRSPESGDGMLALWPMHDPVLLGKDNVPPSPAAGQLAALAARCMHTNYLERPGMMGAPDAVVETLRAVLERARTEK